MSREVNTPEMVELISKKMESSGTNVSRTMVEMILRTFYEIKRDQMLLGNSVHEIGIGVTTPTWRRVSTAFAKVPYTAKLALQIDSNLKKDMNDLIETSPLYRNAIGAQEL